MPIVFVLFVRKLAARMLGRYPISSAVFFINLRDASLIFGLLLSAREIVDAEKFSLFAMS